MFASIARWWKNRDVSVEYETPMRVKIRVKGKTNYRTFPREVNYYVQHYDLKHEPRYGIDVDDDDNINRIIEELRKEASRKAV